MNDSQVVNRRKVELLSPAGDFDCFKSAINAGADAVYLGLKQYGARAYAGNFTIEELNEALDIAHLNNRKIYLTVNTLFKEDEYKGLIESIREPYQNGLDGVIIQDMGVVAALSYYYPKLELHASTQMAVTSISAAKLLKKHGISRIVPARELSLKEIRLIKEEANIELECFIHGAMCYCYSGKCLYSSFLGGRSGNRGRCAQPCRLPYDGEYILSMKDMCTLNIIDRLIDAGIDSFKIEGRMKSPEYVYNVTGKYRKYIDEYLEKNRLKVDKRDRDEILSLYTRSGNHEGYYYKKNGRDMITITSPSYNSGQTANNHKNEDRNDTAAQRPIDIFCRIKEDEELVLYIRDAISNAISNAENKAFDYDNEYCFQSGIIPQKAIKAAVTKELVKKQLLKTGGSNYTIHNCQIDIDDGLFISNGQLNQVRRQALLEYSDCILDRFRRANIKASEDSFDTYLSKLGINDIKKATAQETLDKRDELFKNINISVTQIDQLAELTKFDFVAGVILSLDIFEQIENQENRSLRDKLVMLVNKGLNIYIKLPYIIRNDSKSINEDKLKDNILNIESIMERTYNSFVKGYYISNYESLAVLNALKEESMIKGRVIGDIHMYALSASSILKLKQMGIGRLTVPVELNKKELLRRNSAACDEELIIYGRMPMMVSSQCVLKTKDKCLKCSSGNLTYITDRRKAKLPVLCNCYECSNIIYNSVPLSIATKDDIMNRLSISSIRIMFTDENRIEINNIMGKLNRIMKGSLDGELTDNYTNGHINKGVE